MKIDIPRTVWSLAFFGVTLGPVLLGVWREHANAPTPQATAPATAAQLHDLASIAVQVPADRQPALPAPASQLTGRQAEQAIAELTRIAAVVKVEAATASTPAKN